jgi:putative transposase
MKKEVEKIKAYFEDENYKYWSKISLYYLGLRNKDFAFCKTTFYKYANLLGFSTLRHLKSKQKYQSLATSKPNEIWCADVTKYKLSDGSSYSIHLLMDHYSRKVLGCKISKTPQATNITTLIKNAIVNTKEPPNYFLTDGGSENCNLLVKKLTNEAQIKHLIAQKDISFSNSGIEALNKILKHQFLRKKIITTEKQLKKEILSFINIYNNHRPHAALNGYTPNEKYNNSKDFEWFSTAIKQQKNERSKQNKAKTCKKCIK